jgi:hypothetical protein
MPSPSIFKNLRLGENRSLAWIISRIVTILLVLLIRKRPIVPCIQERTGVVGAV